MTFVQDLREWLQKVLKTSDIKLKVAMKQPWDALKVLSKLVVEHENVQGQIEAGVKWNERIILGKNSVIKTPSRIEGSVIIGDNTVIGPYAYLRGPVVIGSKCRIGSSEIKNSVIMDGTHIPHFSYVGDSVLGKNCNLGAGAKLANTRFDGSIIKVVIDDKEYGSGLRKLGAILEHDVSIGCNAVLNPGSYVGKKGKVFPGTVVSKFVK